MRKYSEIRNYEQDKLIILGELQSLINVLEKQSTPIRSIDIIDLKICFLSLETHIFNLMKVEIKPEPELLDEIGVNHEPKTILQK